MNTICRIVVLSLIPIVVCIASIVFIKDRWARHERTKTAQTQPDPAKTSSELQKPPQPEPAPQKPPVLGIDDYRDARLTLSASLRASSAHCGSGILIAPDRKLILWSREADEPHRIASMTKMMSLLVAFEMIGADGKLSLNTRVKVSRRAELTGGSQIWLATGHEYSLGELMKASMIRSANDATQAFADGLCPDDPRQFVVMMNRRARTLGMHRARFYNVHGLPGKRDNVASCRDIAVLTLELRHHQHACDWAKTLHATFVHNNKKVVEMKNSNRALLTSCKGVTGMKTGYTKLAGFCVAATCERDDELLIAVTTGFKGSIGKKRRLQCVSELFDWGYAELAKLDAQAEGG